MENPVPFRAAVKRIDARLHAEQLKEDIRHKLQRRDAEIAAESLHRMIQDTECSDYDRDRYEITNKDNNRGNRVDNYVYNNLVGTIISVFDSCCMR